ncbi:MAG: TetR/AcrR family transcriptional regulator [Acidimicrobiales bacterium]
MMVPLGLREGRQPGRPRDPTRDDAIRQAAQELLVEVGYDLLTVEAVAARAHASKATIYRRWPSRAELVIDAVGCLARLPDLPDTGSLEEDLRMILEAKGVVDDFRLGVMSGLVSALPRNPDLARVFRDQFVASRSRPLRRVFDRAVARKEIPADRDLDLLTAVFAAMLTHRALIVGKPVDSTYLRTVVEQILLPLAIAPSTTAGGARPVSRASRRANRSSTSGRRDPPPAGANDGPARSRSKDPSPCQ